MVDLHRFPGLAAAPDQVFKLSGGREERQIVEAVLDVAGGCVVAVGCVVCGVGA